MKNNSLIIAIILSITLIIPVIFSWQYQNKELNIKIPVLLYHDFIKTLPDSDPYNFDYINTPQSFEENIKFLLENGYTFISMQELNDGIDGKIELPSKPIIITTDDGYYSNYEYIYPILQKYNVKASIFIVTDLIGKKTDGKKYLDWQQCLEMQNSGLVEILSHSKKHIAYDKLPVKILLEDVIDSYKIIEEKLGKKTLKVFAYPYGLHTKETVRALKSIGIDMQVYDIGMNYFTDFDKHHIKRFNIPNGMPGKEIINIIESN